MKNHPRKTKHPAVPAAKTTFARIYYNLSHPAGYASVSKLQKSTPGGEAKKWLKTQLAYSLHKPIRLRFPTRKYKTSSINELWQMDLMEMIPYHSVNRGYKYILTCIDVFSRYARAAPTLSKNAKDISAGISDMFSGGMIPLRIQTDSGKEFYNKNVQELFRKHKIKHYSVHSQFKAALVERFNRTLRGKLTRYFTHTGKKQWIDVLDSIIDTYNRTPHRGLNFRKPIDVTAENEIQIWQEREKDSYEAPKILLHDYVRVSKVRGPFLKNFDQNWSDEVFRVVAINPVVPTLYTLQDLSGNVINGRFYEPELQSIGTTLPGVYRIEKITATKGTGKHKQYLVKWVGYDSSHNSWISASDIVNG